MTEEELKTLWLLLSKMISHPGFQWETPGGAVFLEARRQVGLWAAQEGYSPRRWDAERQGGDLDE